MRGAETLRERLVRDKLLSEEAEARARELLAMQTKIHAREAALAMHARAISQGPDGRWRTRVKGADGKDKMLVKTNSDDLLDALAEFYAAAERKPIRYGDAFRGWIGEKRARGRVTEATLTRYETHYARYEAVLGDIDLRDVTPESLGEIVAALAREPGLTRRQYGDLHILLRGALQYAARRGATSRTAEELLSGIDLDEIRLTDPPEPAAPAAFTADEERRLLVYFEEHPRPHHLGLALLFRSGLRVGELAALRRDAVDVETLTVTVKATEERHKNSEGHYVHGVQDFPKTHAGRRVVVLPASAAGIIQDIFRICPEGEWLLSYPDGSRIQSRAFRRALRDACEAIGIPPRGTHRIRATYATELLDSRVPEPTVQTQLGHADITTTRRLYHKSRATVDETREQLDKIFGGDP